MEPIGIEVRDGIALVTLAHGKANAMDVALCRALAGAAERCAGRDVRAVVMTGTGRIFSAGVDLRQLVDGGGAYAREFVPLLRASIGTWFDLDKPVVAAVNGHAIAGGCIMACAADVKLMAAGSGRIGVPELLVGVPFPTVALEVVRFALAPQHVQTVVYGGATYEPDDARRLGMIDEVVPADELVDRALERARSLAALDARLFAVTKRQLRAETRARIAAGTEAHDATVADEWSSDETLARVRDYVSRTLGAGARQGQAR